MRPNLSEQLRGLSHILEHVVGPEVKSDYAAQMLLGVIGAMETLSQQAAAVGPFLAWDNDEMRALLRSIATRVPLGDALEPASPIATGDLAALDEENERLRAMLSSTIFTLAGDAEHETLHQAVVAHLRERIARHPYTTVTRSLPSR